MLDIGSSNHGGHIPPLSGTHISLARLRALGGEHMQRGEEGQVDDAIKEIAALLAAAYHAARQNFRLVHTTPRAAASQQKDLIIRVKRALMN